MSKFVIFTPDHKDYFAGFVDAGKGNNEVGTGWEATIEKARMFRTFDQAQKAAQVIADKMSIHPHPYAIQICEVKEKRGQRKIEVLSEVMPAPDRSAWYGDNPMNVTELDGPLALPEIVPVTFVLFREEKDDYLAGIEQKGDIETTQWHPHPEKAIRYATFEEAKAQELVSSKGYILALCELHEGEKKIWIEIHGRCAPTVSGLGSSLN